MFDLSPQALSEALAMAIAFWVTIIAALMVVASVVYARTRS